MLPGSGYLVIALKADNPGVWLAVSNVLNDFPEALHSMEMKWIANGKY
jgi:hypothetical protein